MNPEARLAEIVAALEAVGLNSLVMGGHAVRFYGVDRNTTRLFWYTVIVLQPVAGT